MALEKDITIVKERGLNLGLIKKKRRTFELCMIALEKDIYAFQYVPRKIQTFEMVKFVASREKQEFSWSGRYLDPDMIAILSLVKHKFKNEEVCLGFVKQDYYNLKFVPLKFKTFDLCLIAVKIDGCALKFVPQNLKTMEMCLAALNSCGKAMEFVPSKFMNQEFCLSVIEKNMLDGYILEFVPADIINLEICLLAVKKSGYALKFVPPNIINVEICLIAINLNGSSLEFVPSNIITMEMCLIAIKDNNVYAPLEYVPRKFQTKELVNLAVENNKYNKNFIKKLIKFETNIDNEDDCGICLCNKGQKSKLVCSHFFHTDCIYSWIDKSDNNKCPYCRAHIKLDE